MYVYICISVVTYTTETFRVQLDAAMTRERNVQTLLIAPSAIRIQRKQILNVQFRNRRIDTDRLWRTDIKIKLLNERAIKSMDVRDVNYEPTSEIITRESRDLSGTFGLVKVKILYHPVLEL